MNKLRELQKACDRADAAIVREINKRFPVGTPVVARWGRGWISGIIASEATTLGRFTVHVRTPSGKSHHKHYGDVEIV